MQNKINTLLMVISLVLLTSFLGYWLREEFKSEKKEIRLEKNNEFFEGIIVALETDTISEIRFRDPFLRGGRELLTMRVDSAQDSILRIQKIDSLHTTFEFKTVHQFPERFKVLGKDSLKINSRLELNRATNEVDTFINIGMTSNSPLHSPNAIFFNEEVTPSTMNVLSRMVPQFLISFLIFGTVFTSFLVFGHTLRKQRQLAEMKDDFVANMTHELKTPVSTIGVALEALMNFGAGENPKLRAEYMDITISEVNRLGMLVDKALNISLFEKGKVHFENELIDLEDEIQQIEQTLRVYHDHNNIKFDLVTNGSQFYVKGDRTHLVNVIHNLIENGIKYSDDQKQITLVLEEKDQNVVLHVKDKGKGIALAEQGKIFEKFYRVPTGNVHDTKGHGLGLSYVKMAVEEMRGKVKVESVEGVGSDFIISFPKAEV